MTDTTGKAINAPKAPANEVPSNITIITTKDCIPVIFLIIKGVIKLPSICCNIRQNNPVARNVLKPPVTAKIKAGIADRIGPIIGIILKKAAMKKEEINKQISNHRIKKLQRNYSSYVCLNAENIEIRLFLYK